MSFQRTVWLLSKEQLGHVQMSPSIRLFEMAGMCRSAGFLPRLCIQGGHEHAQPFDAVDFETFLMEWRSGDAVVADAYLPFEQIWLLLERGIPFDLDLYCTSAPESSHGLHRLNRWRNGRSRKKHLIQYSVAIHAAERIYVSTQAQIPMLAGALHYSPYWDMATSVTRLPEKAMLLPMGVRLFTVISAASPYPSHLRDRPIFLWGGGIWEWFDTETLLQAFAGMVDKDHGPALFFLSSSNHRGLASDSPALRTAERAKELGILDRNVFFNARSVSLEDLPGYLQHACAGIMANPPSWEAMISWRTRYLDLLASGKPLVVSGSDPLGDRMYAAGAAWKVESRCPQALRDAVSSCAENASEGCQGSRELGAELQWSNVLAPWIERLANPEAFSSRPNRPSRTWRFRHWVGI